MAMNPYIAEMYNTNGYAEKVAQVEGIVDAFIKQASAEGLDLSGLSDDQIVDYAIDWANEQGGGSDGRDKTAEADYMGRVMAHAYIDEMQKIAIASEVVGDSEAKKVFGATQRGTFAPKALTENATPTSPRMRRGYDKPQPVKELAQKVLSHLKNNKGKYITGAGGLAAGVGGGVLASHLAKKEAAADIAAYIFERLSE